jgi:hypothetical protein
MVISSRRAVEIARLDAAEHDERVPRIWLVPYLRGWSYDLTAQALTRHLSDRFEFSIAYQGRLHRVNGKHDTALIVDFWWKGALHRRFGRRVVKQVSSHRWVQNRYGSLTVRDLIDGHLKRCGRVLVPSVRLRDELAEVSPTVCPKGFHPETFGDYGQRRGGLAVGWAGAAEASDKNVAMLVEACPEIRLADRCLTQDEMPDFYNGIDVITVASDAEGDPRPLIEGMACGAFPVVTNVGIVPELVRHGDNGLIVERSAKAFAEAFAWCRANLDHVREAGRRNAIEMLHTRTWAKVAPAWGDAFQQAIDREPVWPRQPHQRSMTIR